MDKIEGWREKFDELFWDLSILFLLDERIVSEFTDGFC